MSTSDLDAIRARHARCDAACDVFVYRSWLAPKPCDTAVVLAALDESEDEKCSLEDVMAVRLDTAIEREAKLRAALAFQGNLQLAEVDEWAQRLVDAEKRTVAHLTGQCFHGAALATTPEATDAD